MAINPLSADMNNVQKLVIPGLDTDMDIIQKLDDEPNDVGGLSPAELKAEFDKAGNTVKKYINEELLPAISDTVVEAEVRAEAEAGRVQAETERETAEQGRATDEAARADAETLRVEAENQRETAEQGRDTAEAARVDAEAARATAETGRVTAEAGRVAAEVARVSAETAREQAEEGRETAEAERVAAEEQRENAGEGIVARAQAASAVAIEEAGKAVSAQAAIESALDNLPAGAVPVIDDLVTGGAAVALSAGQGVVLKGMVDKAKEAADAAVTTDKLADGAVTTDKLSVDARPIRQQLLDNVDFFNPINERGQTEYTTAGYTIDRWRISHGVPANGLTVTLQSDGIRINCTNIVAYWSAWLQFLENARFSGYTGNLTYSVLYKDCTADNIMWLRVNNNLSFLAESPNAAQGDGLLSVTFPASSITADLLSCGVFFRSPGTATITAAKLELGDHQTLAHQDADGNWVLNDPPPDFGIELLKCQRYFVRLPLTGTRFVGYTQGTIAKFTIPMSVPMRLSTPSITQPAGEGYIYYGTTYELVGAAGFYGAHMAGSNLILTHTLSQNPGFVAAAMRFDNGFIDVSAEL